MSKSIFLIKYMINSKIINHIHELASNMLNNEEKSEYRNDIKILIEMIVHELEINNKKELIIKLFEGL